MSCFNESNETNVCRLCLSDTCVLQDVFSKVEEDDQNLFCVKILDSTSIDIKRDDSLPTCICEECFEQVEKIYQFRQMCRDSEASLQRKAKLRIRGKVQSSSKRECNPPDICVESDSLDLECDEVQTSVTNSLPFEDIPNGGLKYDPDMLDVIIKEESSQEDNAVYRSCKVSLKSAGNFSVADKNCDFSSKKSKYTCVVCGKTFRHKYSLSRHKWSHSKMIFTCRHCHKIFRNNESRLRHERMHVKEKRYQCPMCEKSYVSTTAHAAHVRKHTGERPYKCAECEETFNLLSSYERHTAKHRGVRDIVCEICSATFWVADDLRAHVNRMH